MNRKLKFRIWNGTEMIYDITVGKFGTFYVNPGNNGHGLDPNDLASLTPFTTKYSDNTPIMQFTDHHDKNGTEIFEDDILHIEGMMDVKFGVTFQDAAFQVYEWGTDNYSPLPNSSQCVVIGNIYTLT
jgi:hypothetical protein